MKTELTPLEIDILRYVAMGKTNEEIAQILGVSIYKIKYHLITSSRLLNVFNRVGAAYAAVKKGYVTL